MYIPALTTATIVLQAEDSESVDKFTTCFKQALKFCKVSQPPRDLLHTCRLHCRNETELVFSDGESVITWKLCSKLTLTCSFQHGIIYRNASNSSH